MTSGIMRTTTVLLIWLVLVAFTMMCTRALNLELFFVLWLIAALVITEILPPHTMHPRWKIIQTIIIGVAVVIFTIIIVIKIIEIVT